MESPKKPYHNYIKYSGMGIQMAATIMVAAWLGSVMDENYRFEKPYLTLLFMLMGTMAAIYLFARQLNQKVDT